MSLTESQITRLVACFQAVELRLDELENAFYIILFDDAPQLRSLFPDDLTSQKHHMGEAIKLLAMNVANLDGLAGMLREMGTRHVGYGTDAESYPIVCNAMVKSFAKIMGDAWTEQLEADWADVFVMVSQYMIEGAERLSDELS